MLCLREKPRRGFEDRKKGPVKLTVGAGRGGKRTEKNQVKGEVREQKRLKKGKARRRHMEENTGLYKPSFFASSPKLSIKCTFSNNVDASEIISLKVKFLTPTSKSVWRNG